MGIARVQYNTRVYTNYRITKLFLSYPAYCVHFVFKLCRSYPGKKAKIFESGKGLPPDVIQTLMGDRSSPNENEIPINSSISYC